MENRFMADILIKYIYKIQEVNNSKAWKIIKRIKIRKIINDCMKEFTNRVKVISSYTSFDIINLALLYDTAIVMGLIESDSLGESCSIICHKGIAKSRWPMMTIISFGLPDNNQITLEAGMDNEYDNTGHITANFLIKSEDIGQIGRNNNHHLDIDSIEPSTKTDADSRRITTLFHMMPYAYTSCFEAIIDGMKERYLK